MKAFKIIVFALLFLSLGLPAFSDDKEVDREKRDLIYQWIKEHVVGKTVVKPQASEKIADGAVETVHGYKEVYGNLVKTDLGLYFDSVWMVEQVNYDLDEKGNHTGEAQVWNRAGAGRSEFRVMESTGGIVGHWKPFTNTVTDITGIVTRKKIRLEDDKLIIESSFVNYTDYFDKGGEYKPGGSESVVEMWVENGKLHVKSSGIGYNLNPKTLEKISVSNEWESVAIEP